MTTERVTVQYINEPKPGRKTGSIKTTDGRYFDVWPNLLPQFQKGKSYEIETESREYNSKTYVTAKRIISNGAGSGPSNGSSDQPAPNDNSERQNRIERQHSQEMALRFFAIVGKAPKLEELKPAIDFFQNDIRESLAPVAKPAAAQAGEPEAANTTGDDLDL
jgi:hypothetical protein